MQEGGFFGFLFPVLRPPFHAAARKSGRVPVVGTDGHGASPVRFRLRTAPRQTVSADLRLSSVPGSTPGRGLSVRTAIAMPRRGELLPSRLSGLVFGGAEK